MAANFYKQVSIKTLISFCVLGSHLPAQPQLFPISNNITAYNPNVPVYAVIDTLLVNVSAYFLLIPYPNNVDVSIFFQLTDKSMLNLENFLKYALAYIST